MKVMITGGGTGGHTSPALAIVEELRKRDPQLLVQWVGREGSIEERVAAANEIPFRAVPVEGWPRKAVMRRAWVAVKLAAGLARAATHLRKFQPQVVIGVGGYVSLPLLWAAQRFGAPTVLHEQNKRLGMANRMLAEKARRIYLSFPDTLGEYPRERARVVGNPVRTGFVNPPDAAAARRRLELDPDKPVVLVTGGSQGAGAINRAMTDALPSFAPDEAQFLWMTGTDDAPAARDLAARLAATVRVFHFIEDMATASAAADLIIGRAGASTTAEIAVLGKPSILIPYPHATDNHQEENARAFADVGAAVVLLNDECTGPRLAEEIRRLLADPEARDRMSRAARTLGHPNAAETLVDDLFDIVFGPEPAPEL